MPNQYGRYDSLNEALADVCRKRHLVPQPFGRYMSTETGQYYTKKQLTDKYVEEIHGGYYLKNCY